jgi:acetoin utilization deacetylase AcuC-like enzyme
MPVGMKVVWSDRCLLHEPEAEIWIGMRTDGTEVPARATAIRHALTAERATVVEAAEHPDAALLRVHDAALVDYLRGAWQEWVDAGLPVDPGQDRVVPYVFAHAALTGERPPRVPTAVWARPGYFAYDTMTLVGPGTWEAARAGADAALTAVDHVLAGDACAYACTRPPGHHVCRGCYGGSCYLNNAAVAAAGLAELGTVGVLDVDAHHGNGTQEIFYARSDVLVGSVHVDPGAGWFPHFLGFADERGSADGEGANLNLPVAPGSGDDTWLEAVTSLTRWARNVNALVVALGVDAAAGDPESPLHVTTDGYRSAGRLIGALGLPTVIVQEGGYDLARLGELVVAFLLGLEEGRP